jgi:polysaccharide biosynthesis transport protein
MNIQGSRRDDTGEFVGQVLSPVKPDRADLLGIARRGRVKIAISTLAGLTSALLLLSTITPVYRANARLIIDKSFNKFMQSNKVLDEPIFDDAGTLSQIHIITSESVVLPVVRSLDLANDAEFVSPPSDAGIGSRIRTFVASVKSKAGFGAARTIEKPDPERIAFDGAMRRLFVTREDVPNVINISFESKDPQKAANISNAIADGYLASTVAGKISSTQIVSRLMRERLAELKTQAADAERGLTEYKLSAKLTGAGAKTRSSEELSILAGHLAQARVTLAEAKARLNPTTKDGRDAGNTAPPENELLTLLRRQHLDVAQRATDIERRVGKGHAAVAAMRRRLADIRTAITDEELRVSKTSFELASARYGQLNATMAQVLGEETATSPALARLRELESAAETLRTLYNNMLQRYNETSKVDVSAPITSDAMIITRAAIPTQSEPSKKRLLGLALGSLFGFLFGVGLIFLREFPFGVFRTAEQVTQATGLFCAILPRVNTKHISAQNPAAAVVSRPFSRFAEALRMVWSLVKVRKAETTGQVICVTSAVPHEGKTTVATSLASLIASQSKVPTLLIDADFRRHTLTDAMASGSYAGLKEALENPARLSDFVIRQPESGLEFLPCPVTQQPTNASELLGSAQMKELLAVARDRYSAIIIEVAPIAPVADFRMIAPFCDEMVLVVEWGKTTQKIVLESLAQASGLFNGSPCIVLNKADPAALKSIDNYKGSEYLAYYKERAA